MGEPPSIVKNETPSISRSATERANDYSFLRAGYKNNSPWPDGVVVNHDHHVYILQENRGNVKFLRPDGREYDISDKLKGQIINRARNKIG